MNKSLDLGIGTANGKNPSAHRNTSIEIICQVNVCFKVCMSVSFRLIASINCNDYLDFAIFRDLPVTIKCLSTVSSDL